MSINPILNTTTHEPLRMEGEYFIIRRNDIEYELLTEQSGKYSGLGYLILTSVRIVIVSNDLNNLAFHSFEMPLSNIYGEAYNQPFFGKNYLSGTCQALFASPIGKVTFKIWFKQNACGTLVPIFYNLIDSLRHNQNKKHDQHIMTALKNGDFNTIFAIDPDDPSTIYSIQPEAIPLPKPMSQSVMPNNVRPNMMISGVNNNNNPYNNMNNIPVESAYNVYNNNQNNQINNANQYVYKDPGQYQYKEPNDNFSNPYVPKSNNNIIANNNVFPLFPNNDNTNIVGGNNDVVFQGKAEEVSNIKSYYPDFDNKVPELKNPYIVNEQSNNVYQVQNISNVQGNDLNRQKDNGTFSLLAQDQNFHEPLIDNNNNNHYVNGKWS